VPGEGDQFLIKSDIVFNAGALVQIDLVLSDGEASQARRRNWGGCTFSECYRGTVQDEFASLHSVNLVKKFSRERRPVFAAWLRSRRREPAHPDGPTRGWIGNPRGRKEKHCHSRQQQKRRAKRHEQELKGRWIFLDVEKQDHRFFKRGLNVPVAL